jgi:hypothetical protein
MFLYNFGVHENVININEKKFIQIFMKKGIHLGCEHLWNVTQPKRHDQKLIQFVLGFTLSPFQRSSILSKLNNTPT